MKWIHAINDYKDYDFKTKKKVEKDNLLKKILKIIK